MIEEIVDDDETTTSTKEDSMILSSNIKISRKSSESPSVSENNGYALSTYIELSSRLMGLMTVAKGLTLLCKLGLDFEYNVPLITVSLVCFCQLSGLIFVGSVKIPRE